MALSHGHEGPSNDDQPSESLIKVPHGVTPDMLPLTTEEQSLLDLYATVRSYEREAAKLRETAAKAKLAAASEKYQRELATQQGNKESDTDGQDDKAGKRSANSQPRSRKSGGTKKKAKQGTNSDYENDDDKSLDGESDASEGPNDLSDSGDERDRLRDAKIAKMRSESDRARQVKIEEERKAREQEELIQEHLADGTDIGRMGESGPLLVKKRNLDPIGGAQQSLISQMDGQATPPHEFSKSLGMSKANLTGKVLFPTHQEGVPAANINWTPPTSAYEPNDGCLTLDLSNFDASQASAGHGNNTIAVKFTAPEKSKRFSVNIAAPDHNNYHSVLFHFNPRQREKGGQVVINDKKDGIWGQAINIPLSNLPVVFGQLSSTLIIQINGEGYDVFLGGKHCARLEHRSQLPLMKCALQLQFPSTDDYGNTENWTVYRVWWGHKPLMASGDLSTIPGVNIHSAIHPKKLFISGLTKIFTEPEVDLRRAELERAFRKYGGALGVVATIPTNSTFAFVEVESERHADLALAEMAGQYRMIRARRSRHEALQEERAAAEAANNSIKKSEWN